MAKGQQRSGKEPRKPKADKNKKLTGPKYLRPPELIATAKGAPRTGQSK